MRACNASRHVRRHKLKLVYRFSNLYSYGLCRAYVVMASILMVYIVMAYVGRAYVVMANLVMACVGVAHIFMAYI